MGQKKLHSNWKMQRRERKREQRKTSLGMIRPRKRVQGSKEDRRFVYRETSRGLNEGSSYRREKKKADRSGLYRLSDRRRRHPGQHLQVIHSVSSQVRQRKVRGGKGTDRWSRREVV